eukprot:14642955-Heterocapsa_arctica.AAC.1
MCRRQRHLKDKERQRPAALRQSYECAGEEMQFPGLVGKIAVKKKTASAAMYTTAVALDSMSKVRQ